MRVTIIRGDGVVGVDFVFRKVDLSALPTSVRAVQWDGTKGHVEYDNAPEDALDSIIDYQPFIDLWTAAAPPPPPPPTPAQLIAAAHARINTAYQSAANALTSGYPADEISSWPKQESEARAWLADSAAATPWLDSASTARGITKADLVTRIMDNAALFTTAHGQLTGKRQKLRDEIDAIGSNPTQSQLDAIQW